jgi:Na+-translocating ferredoxin:NAD+ oxidoreductase RnfG subunit
MTERRAERILALIAVVTIAIAGLLGFIRKADDFELEIASLITDKEILQVEGEGRYTITGSESEKPQAYMSVVGAEGYGGEIRAAVRIDLLGNITDFQIISHSETPSFLKKVIQKGLIRQLKGATYADSFDSDQGIDVVSGATYTSIAIIECAKAGSRQIAKEELGLEAPADIKTKFSLGIPEIALVLLYLVALVGVYTSFPYKKMLRWTTLVAGLVILGFWFSLPLTLSRINLFLIGFWPNWHDHLYWYILVFGFFLTLLVTRKNIYCSWICPLGCIQDGIGLVGAARPRFSKKVNHVMKWVQRFVAWLAIVLALYYRNPVQLNYEIFGVSLSLTGATYLFIMTGIFFIASVFITRPWCNYLCPITPVADLFRLLTRSLNKNQ